jgi:hypothetical protein
MGPTPYRATIGAFMRFARVLLATAAVLCGGASCTEAAANAAGVWIEVSPATITAGFQVSIRASCGDNANPATVKSNAFGTVTLQPVGGLLSTQVTVPPDTPKGTYDVRLTCPTGSRANTTLTVLNTATVTHQATLGPNTGGGFLAGDGSRPADRSPFVWLGVGLTSLLAAAAVAVRTKRSRRRALIPGQPDEGAPVAVRRR